MAFSNTLFSKTLSPYHWIKLTNSSNEHHLYSMLSSFKIISVSVSLTLEIKTYSIQSFPKDLYLNIQFKYVDSNKVGFFFYFSLYSFF